MLWIVLPHITFVIILSKAGDEKIVVIATAFLASLIFALFLAFLLYVPMVDNLLDFMHGMQGGGLGGFHLLNIIPLLISVYLGDGIFVVALNILFFVTGGYFLYKCNYRMLVLLLIWISSPFLFFSVTDTGHMPYFYMRHVSPIIPAFLIIISHGILYTLGKFRGIARYKIFNPYFIGILIVLFIQWPSIKKIVKMNLHKDQSNHLSNYISSILTADDFIIDVYTHLMPFTWKQAGSSNQNVKYSSFDNFVRAVAKNKLLLQDHLIYVVDNYIPLYKTRLPEYNIKQFGRYAVIHKSSKSNINNKKAIITEVESLRKIALIRISVIENNVSKILYKNDGYWMPTPYKDYPFWSKYLYAYKTRLMLECELGNTNAIAQLYKKMAQIKKKQLPLGMIKASWRMLL